MRTGTKKKTLTERHGAEGTVGCTDYERDTILIKGPRKPFE
jgi:hypothetical protein